MSFYNKLLENWVLPLGDGILATSYMRELKKWRKIQELSRDELDILQKSNLERTLTNAVKFVPFYIGLDISLTGDPLHDLKQFPVLTKSILNSSRNDLINGDINNLIENSSSGSTGHRVSTFDTKKTQSSTRAVHTLLWEWAGFELGKPFFQLGMELKRGFVKKMKDNLLRTDYTQAFHLEKSDVIKNLQRYRNTANTIFGGYASGLYAYAVFANEENINDVQFRSVLSWGDKMFPHYRSLIESQFHTKVYDLYACGEGIVVAAQCEEMNYHIITPHVFMEVIDQNGDDASPGELGRVILTRLDNDVMPIIRYEVGDLAIVDDKSKLCDCGKKFPLMKKIIGRDTDIVYSRSGKFMIVHFFTGIFEYIPEIKQFRVIQRDLNGIEIEYIKAVGFHDSALQTATDKILGYLKEDFTIEYTEVDYIPPTSSGKPQIIKSEIKSRIEVSG